MSTTSWDFFSQSRSRFWSIAAWSRKGPETNSPPSGVGGLHPMHLFGLEIVAFIPSQFTGEGGLKIVESAYRCKYTLSKSSWVHAVANVARDCSYDR